MDIASATSIDLAEWVAMRTALWPDEDGLDSGARQMLDEPPGQSINLICRIDGEAAGFAEATLRHDYVNGCETTPVAFLEGIYVAPAHRRLGIARAMVDRVAQWARERGCTEFASDALLDNRDSHRFHAAIGFDETERVVYFRRAL